MSGILQSFIGSIAGEVPEGQERYTTPGTHSWTAPVGVSSVSVVCVGGGGASGGGAGGAGGTGGGLGYLNNLSVGSGQAYTVVVGEGGGGTTGAAGGAGTDSYFINTSNVKGGGGSSTVSRNVGGTGGTYTGTGGGNGGDGANSPGSNAGGGGGGAGGYSGAGGDGSSGGDGDDGIGGGGGGGATIVQGNNQAGGGGGVGVFGEGSSGAGGSGSNSSPLLQGGHGGSGGLDGGDGSHNSDIPNHGGQYGGGPGAMGGGGDAYDGAPGAVRIIWPGLHRQFPSNNTGDVGDDFGGSVYFDGDDVLKIENNYYTYQHPDDEWKIATNEAFSFEAWVKFDFSHTSYSNVFSNWTTANSYAGILFHVQNTGKIFLGFRGGTYTSGSSYLVSDDTWTHVAVTRNAGSAGKFFIGGVEAGTWTNSQSSGTDPASMYIGANMDGGNPAYEPKGYISNARVVIGEQVYTSNFTPSTELLTTTSQGVTAVNCTWLGCQSRTSLTEAVDGAGLGASASIAVSDPTASVETPFA